MALPFQFERLSYKRKIVARRSIIIIIHRLHRYKHTHSKTVKANLCHERHFSLFSSFGQLIDNLYVCIRVISIQSICNGTHSTRANCHRRGVNELRPLTGQISIYTEGYIVIVLRKYELVHTAHCLNKFKRCQWIWDKEMHTHLFVSILIFVCFILFHLKSHKIYL